MSLAHVMDQVSVPDDDDTSPRCPFECEDTDDFAPCPSVSPSSDSVSSVLPGSNQSLEWDECVPLEDLVSTLYDVFSETPFCTDTLQHDIVLTITKKGYF